jgi:hypothetical protein
MRKKKFTVTPRYQGRGIHPERNHQRWRYRKMSLEAGDAKFPSNPGEAGESSGGRASLTRADDARPFGGGREAPVEEINATSGVRVALRRHRARLARGSKRQSSVSLVVVSVIAVRLVVFPAFPSLEASGL